MKGPLIIAALLLPFIASAVPESIEARWNADSMLIRFDGQCHIIPVASIRRVNDDWTLFSATASTNLATCADVKWIVAPNRSYLTRPIKKLVEGVLVDTKERIEINKPCTGDPMKVTRAGRWMEVKHGFYALCRAEQ